MLMVFIRTGSLLNVKCTPTATVVTAITGLCSFDIKLRPDRLTSQLQTSGRSDVGNRSKILNKKTIESSVAQRSRKSNFYPIKQ